MIAGGALKTYAPPDFFSGGAGKTYEPANETSDGAKISAGMLAAVGYGLSHRAALRT